jgi:hypothetical protein
MNMEQKRDYVIALQRLSSLVSAEMRKALDDYLTATESITTQSTVKPIYTIKRHQKSKRKTRQ